MQCLQQHPLYLSSGIKTLHSEAAAQEYLSYVNTGNLNGQEQNKQT